MQIWPQLSQQCQSLLVLLRTSLNMQHCDYSALALFNVRCLVDNELLHMSGTWQINTLPSRLLNLLFTKMPHNRAVYALYFQKPVSIPLWEHLF